MIIESNLIDLKRIIYRLSLSGNGEIENLFRKLSEIPQNNLEDRKNLQFYIKVITDHFNKRISTVKYYTLLFELAGFCRKKGELECAKRLFKLIISKSNSNQTVRKSNLQARSYLELSKCESLLGSYTKSGRYLKQAKLLFSKKNDRIGLAETENLVGAIYTEMGDYENAIKQFEYARSSIKNTKSSIIKGKIESNLGVISTVLQRFTEAIEYYDSALEIYYSLSEATKIAETEYNLGMLLLRLNMLGDAINYLKSANKCALNQNMEPVSAIAYLGLAEALYRNGEYESAEDHVIKSLEISFRINDRFTIAEGYKLQALIHKEVGLYSSAEHLLLTSIKISRKGVKNPDRAHIHFELSKLYQELYREQDAEKHFDQYRRLLQLIKT